LNDVLCVELEIGFPGLYVDQPGFGELDGILTAAGFFLFDLRVAASDISHGGGTTRSVVFRAAPNSRSITKRIGEADGVYFRRVDQVIAQKNPAVIRRLIVMMCSYGFFIDALDLADRALAAGIFNQREAETCRSAIVAWHRTQQDAVLETRWFARLDAFGRRAWRSLQRRLTGRQFHRWTD
jgi:hypothetical protein